jgi:hypothetical protein
MTGDFLDQLWDGNLRGAAAIAAGQGVRDEAALTNLLFRSIHLELGGRSIQKTEKELARDWLFIRDDVVRR